MITPYIIPQDENVIKESLLQISTELPNLISTESIDSNTDHIIATFQSLTNFLKVKLNPITTISILLSKQDEIVPYPEVTNIIKNSSLLKECSIKAIDNDHNFNFGYDDAIKWIELNV